MRNRVLGALAFLVLLIPASASAEFITVDFHLQPTVGTPRSGEGSITIFTSGPALIPGTTYTELAGQITNIDIPLGGAVFGLGNENTIGAATLALNSLSHYSLSFDATSPAANSTINLSGQTFSFVALTAPSGQRTTSGVLQSFFVAKVVPEPSSLLLMMSGLAMAGAFFWFTAKQRHPA